MACAVALKNLDIIEQERLIENAEAMGQELLKGLHRIQQERKIVGKVKGLGLMAGIEIVQDLQIKERYAAPLSPAIVTEAANQGLICRSVVLDEQDIVVFAPPLTINKYEITKMIEILNNSIRVIEADVTANYVTT
jgi:adenosylmethionine-8-amino-7-oxononanoate aminotransferase